MRTPKLYLPLAVLIVASLACSFSTNPATPLPAVNQPAATAQTVKAGDAPALTSAAPTAASPEPAQARPTGLGSDEPVAVSGDIPYTNPFFVNSLAEPFVLLEDEAGFVKRDREFRFSLPGQTIGPVEISKDKKLTYNLTLPAVPQATMVDVDNNGKQDPGVQVFAVAFWSNIWGGPFLEERDGKGWSTASTSVHTDPERDDEFTGGTLLVWAPDGQQGFPTGFGPDNKLFTADDPTAPIPAGYTWVDMNQQPFRFYKETHPQLTLEEGVGAVKDYSKMSYGEAFKAFFEKASREYPFTQEKNVDWQALSDEFLPRAEKVSSDVDFSRLMRDFVNRIPDQHIGFSLDPKVFYENYGGGFGLNLTLLSDGRLVVSHVLPNSAAEQAGIKPGAEIVTWNDAPPKDALAKVTPGFGPYSADHTRLDGQVQFLTRVPPDTSVNVSFKNPDSSQVQQATLASQQEYDSLIQSMPSASADPLALPLEAKILPGSGLGYIKIDTFSDDYNLMARQWERFMQSLVDNKVPGLIIDLRNNGGGSSSMAFDFAGYLFDREVPLFDNYYYKETTGKFEKTPYPSTIKPGPMTYSGPIAVLVGSNCVSACEGFAYALKQNGRSKIVGFEPTAGAFGEVGLGQYKLPGDVSGQIPTGKSIAPDGTVVIEGVGVVPDILVPITLQSVLGTQDPVLDAAIQALR